MSEGEHIRRCRCGTRLARDNHGSLCNACTKAARRHRVEPPAVPPEFWHTPQMRHALASCDMGAVMRAFRTHPHHGRDICQEVAAGWVGISQTRLSRIENGEGITSLKRLVRWAHVLRVPTDLLWFRMPGTSTATVRAKRHDGALLPVIVEGRPVMLPVDADKMKARGLGSLLDELGVMAPASGSAVSAPEWETMSPLTRRSLLGRGIAAALPMLDPRQDGRERKPTVAQFVKQVHSSYQAARYHEAALALPPLMASIRTLVDEGPAQQRRQALRLECSASVAAAKLETKAGDGAAALGSAHRARRAALEADDPFGEAAASYQLACALLKLGQREEAELVAVEHARSIAGTDPESLTWRGALTLISSIIAARRNDPTEANSRLDHAEALAERLGADGNIGWTAFGPTNVRIHRMSAAVALTDPRATLTVAEQIDVVSMPSNLRGRQAQYHLDGAWAHCRLNEDLPALIHLLDAERVAPELVLGAPGAQSLISELIGRERRVQMPGLRSLAQRAGVLA